MLIFILSLLTAFAPLSIDMYLPSLPTLVHVYGTNEANVQLTLSSFLLGFALAQLVYGPMSDRFGRKPVIIFGIILYIAASIGAAQALSVETMIAMRFLQGIGGSAGPVLARAMVRDLFSRDESAQVLSILVLVMGVAPMVAPLIGGQVLIIFSWQGIFWILSAFGLFCLILTIWKLQETHPANKRTSHNFFQMMTGYIPLIKNRCFLGYAACGGFGFGGMFAYISGSPFVFIDLFGFSAQTFGFLFGAYAIAIMFGAAVNARLVKKVGSDTMLTFGAIMSCSIGSMLALLTFLEIGGQLGLLVTLFFFMPSVMITGTNAMAGGLAIFQNRAGTAAALMGAIQFSIGSSAGALVGILYSETPVAMVSVIASCGILNLVSKLTLVRKNYS